MDQMVKNYKSYRKSRRYTVVLFSNMLDTAALNAYVIYTANHPEWLPGKRDRRRRFLIELGKQLVVPAVQRRRTTNFSIPLRASVETFLRSAAPHEDRNEQLDVDVEDTAALEKEQQPSSCTSIEGGTRKKQRRCHICGRGPDRKVATTCSLCRKNICKKHRRTVTSSLCTNCAGKS